MAMIKRIILFLSVVSLFVHAGCTSFEKIQPELYQAVYQGENRLEVLNGKYVISSPDVIQIAVQDNPGLGTTSVIGPDGNVFIPLLGDIYVDGLTILQLREKMHKLVGRYLKDLPIESISAQVVGYNSKKVFVYNYGAVGINAIRFTGNLTILDVLSQTGYLSTSNKKKITIIRPEMDLTKKPQKFVFNLNDLMKRGRSEDNLILRHNDIIYIPPTIFGRFTVAIRKVLEPVRPVADVGSTYSDMKYDALGFDTQGNSGSGSSSRR